MNPFIVKVNSGEEIKTLSEAVCITEEQIDEANDITNLIARDILEGKIETNGALMVILAEKLSQEQALVVLASVIIEIVELKYNPLLDAMIGMGQSKD